MPTRRRFLGTTLIGGIGALLSGSRATSPEPLAAARPTERSETSADIEFRRYLRIAASAQAAPGLDS